MSFSTNVDWFLYNVFILYIIENHEQKKNVPRIFEILKIKNRKQHFNIH